MKTVWGIFAFSVVFSLLALFMLFRGKVEVEPLRVLNPTNFAAPEEIGAVVFRRFWQEVTSNRLVVLGSSPFLRDYDRVWSGFLSVAGRYNIKFSRIFAPPGLRVLTSNVEPLDWQKVREALADPGARVLVQVGATDQMWKDTRDRAGKAFVIFQNVLPVSEEEKEWLRLGCHENSELFQISCQALRTFQNGKRRKFDPKALTAVIEKAAEQDEGHSDAHLLFVHESAK